MSYKKVRVVVEIEIPEGATHYSGRLDDMPTFFKKKDINGPHWFDYYEDRDVWILFGQQESYEFLKPLETVE